jgi:tryptophan synthase alpha chain
MGADETKLGAALRSRIDGGGKAFIPYVTGGLASVDAALLRRLEAAGADAIEVGVPFSDPIIDGGVIQEASRLALEAGFHPRDAFELVATAALGIPVILMGYENPVMAMGEDAWIAGAVAAGVAGFIIPDLPVDEGASFGKACISAGVAPVFMAAPGTGAERMALVAESSRGFVYCMASYGVTGSREELSSAGREVVETLRPLTDRALLIGVGISTPEQAAEACDYADGCIVGSAIVRPLLEGDVEGAITVAELFRDAIHP